MFTSHMDNQICQAKNNDVKLLPDEEAVDCLLRVLFWLGLKESVKDKARHKKDSCKTFTDLIAVAHCGKKESNSTQFPQ